MSHQPPPPPPPTQPPGKVSYDPGWNDPPKLGYSPQSGQSKPRTLLNKRVAFPLSGTNSVPNVFPPNLPLMPETTAQPVLFQPVLPVAPPPCTPVDTQNYEKLEIDSETALKEVLEIFNNILEETSELGPKIADIRKRLALMENMWISDKLSVPVQSRMRHLAIALKEDRPSDADFQQKALMVEHVSSVSQWMTGVRQLVNHCIIRHDLISMDKEE